MKSLVCVFFYDKITKIGEAFSNTHSFKTPAPLSFLVFLLLTVSLRKKYRKISLNLPQNFPLVHFSCERIFLLPLTTKLVKGSTSEGFVPEGSKNALVTPLIKKASLPHYGMKNYHPVTGLCFISKLVE